MFGLLRIFMSSHTRTHTHSLGNYLRRSCTRPIFGARIEKFIYFIFLDPKAFPFHQQRTEQPTRSSRNKKQEETFVTFTWPAIAKTIRPKELRTSFTHHAVSLPHLTHNYIQFLFAVAIIVMNETRRRLVFIWNCRRTFFDKFLMRPPQRSRLININWQCVLSLFRQITLRTWIRYLWVSRQWSK